MPASPSASAGAPLVLAALRPWRGREPAEAAGESDARGREGGGSDAVNPSERQRRRCPLPSRLPGHPLPDPTTLLGFLGGVFPLCNLEDKYNKT